MIWQKKSHRNNRFSAIKNSSKCHGGLTSTLLDPIQILKNVISDNEIWFECLINWINLNMISMIWRKKNWRENRISGAECARIYNQKLVKISWRIDFHSTLFSRQQILMNRIWGDEIWIEAVRCCDSWMFSLLLLKMITIMVFLGIGKINVIKGSFFITCSKKWTRNSFTVPV